jgi:hypothetical protein
MPSYALNITVTAKDQASGALKGIGSALGGLGKAALMGGAVVGAAVGGIGLGMAKLAMDAAPLEGIQNAFAGIAESSGSSMATMLAALQKGSLGMVTQKDLMMTYNSAAQLVGTTFANQLPDAMGYLSKVSAATGQDMGFMLDSLVKGVGRLSPMILDNLGIQVALSEATDRASEMFGVEASALDKTQTQAGMMNVVLEKLAANTAAMPDILGSAAQQQAKLSATFKDAKDQIGLALLPVWNKLLSGVMKGIDAFMWLKSVVANLGIENLFKTFSDGSSIMGRFLQKLGMGEETANAVGRAINSVAKFLERVFTGAVKIASQFITGTLVPAFQKIASVVGEVIGEIKRSVEAGLNPFETLMEVLDNFLPEDVISRIWEFATAIGEFVPKAIETLVGFWESALLPALEALGAFVIDTVIPAIGELVKWLAENIPKAIEVLVGFWESTLRPALEALGAFIIETVIPAIVELVAWFAENIPKAMEILAEFWESTLLPALTAIMGFVRDVLIPALGELASWLANNIPGAMDTLKGIWEGTLRPALEALGEFIKNPVIPAIEKLFGWLKEKIPEAMDTLKGIWENTLKPALEKLAEFIKDPVIPAIEKLFDWLKEKIPQAIGILVGFWENILKPALEALADFIKDPVVPIIEKLFDWLRDKIPEAFKAVETIWNSVLKPVLDVLYGFLANTLIPVISDVVSWFAEKIPAAFDAVRQWWNNTGAGLFGTIKDVIQTIVDALAKVVEAAGNVMDALGKIKMPEINLPNLVPGSILGVNMPWGQHGGFTGGGPVFTHPGEALIPLTNQSGINALAAAMQQAIGQTGADQRTQFFMTANYQHQERDSLTQDVRFLNLIYGGT